MTEQKLYKELREKYGDLRQQNKAIEEMAELIQAINKGQEDIYEHGYITAPAMANITEEMADVCIMLDQLISMFDNGYEVKMMMKEKLERTERRLREEKERSVKWE